MSINTNTLHNHINEHIPESYNVIHICEVGSHMWGMNHIDSDHDLIVIYSAPSSLMLRGELIKSTLLSHHNVTLDGERFDIQFMEIGHLTNLLIKGNISAIWAILTPLIHYKTQLIPDIKTSLLQHSPITTIVPSACGMARSQLSSAITSSSYLDTESSNLKIHKHLLIACRTMEFTYDYLKNNIILFKSTIDYSNKQLQDLTTIILAELENNIKQHHNIEFETDLRELLYMYRLLSI